MRYPGYPAGGYVFNGPFWISEGYVHKQGIRGVCGGQVAIPASIISS